MPDKSIFSQFTNLYTVQKTIGFYAKGNIKIPEITNVELDQDILSKLEELQSNLKDIIYYKDSDGKIKGLNKGLKVRKFWAKEYCNEQIRQLILNDRKKAEIDGKKYQPKKDIDLETDFVTLHISQWFETIQNSTTNLQKYLNFYITQQKLPVDQKNKLEKARQSEIDAVLKQLATKSILPSIIEFLNRTKNKKTSENDILNENTRNLAKQILEQIQSILNSNSVHTIKGSRIYRASLNYYTVNKLPKTEKEYTEEKEKLENELKANCTGFNVGILANINLIYNGTRVTTLNNLTLKQASDLIKNYKSEQKKLFNEKIAELIRNGYDETNIDCQAIFGEFGLFGNTDERPLRDYLQKTIEIKKLSDEYNQTRSEDTLSKIKKQAVERGKFFQTKCGNYTNLCDLYKEIRMREGAIIGKIKNLEAEQIESQFITHWGLITTNSLNKLGIILVPKVSRDDFKYYLGYYKQEPKELLGCTIVHNLKSLTLKSLLKQINVNPNYHKEIADELTDEQKDNITIRYCINQINGGTLDTSYFELDKEILNSWSQETNLDKFRERLETKCYKFIKYYIPDQKFKEITKNYEKFELDSFDIRKRPETNRVNPENHTNIWDEFLKVVDKSGKGNTRLNPEFSINYRKMVDDTPTKFTKLGKEIELENRRNKERFRVIFNVSENTNKPTPKTTKINTLDQINEFNIEFQKDFNKWQDKEGYYTFYGIDRGSDEMATLCKVKLNPNNIYTNPVVSNAGKEKFPLYDPKFELFEYYRLKDGVDLMASSELQQLLKNPSYYLSTFENRIDIFNKYFEEVSSSCLDLTSAKLIKSEFHNKSIILEVGDLYTYLRFKIENSKYILYDLLINSRTLNQNLTWEENKLKYDSTDIYFYGDLEIKTKEDLQKELEGYSQNLYDSLKITKICPNELEKQKLWNLKKALSANCVGILSNLYQSQKGFIVLENLNSSLLDRQTIDKTAIHRQLEQSIYQKWQNYGTVPPKVNMPNMWKSLFGNDDKQLQLGNIILINEENTSNSCPRCGIVNREYSDQKWTQHRFGCIGDNTGNCGFDTGSKKTNPNIEPNLCDLIGLTTSDSVASYNIAKRGLEFVTKNDR
jgi:hypothetical protein